MAYPIRFVNQLSPQLRALRKARGLTQAELAKLIGTTQSRIAATEAKPGSTSVAHFIKILSALNAQLAIQTTKTDESANAIGGGNPNSSENSPDW